jgi:hypothetical protein
MIMKPRIPETLRKDREEKVKIKYRRKGNLAHNRPTKASCNVFFQLVLAQ